MTFELIGYQPLFAPMWNGWLGVWQMMHVGWQPIYRRVS